jgi:predicted metal-dependent HD superfamily phosphohydrolase
MAAAWLHDIGYTKNRHHETAGQLFREAVTSLTIEEGLIGRINELLMITPGFHDPVDQLEEIMCDAGTYYLAKRSFFRKNELQRKEQSALQAKKITKGGMGAGIRLLDHRSPIFYGHRP